MKGHMNMASIKLGEIDQPILGKAVSRIDDKKERQNG